MRVSPAFPSILCIVGLAGCQLGGGPVLGYRGGRPTIGWQAGPGVYAGELRFIRADVGQSYRAGRFFTYGTLGATEWPRIFHPYRYGIGGAIGIGGDGGGPTAVVGVDGFAGAIFSDDCQGAIWIGSVALGVRMIGGSAEVYLAPRLDALAFPCGD